MSATLPEPSPAALASSRELTRRIVDAIDTAGGWIGFDHYMQQALYEPGLGYYAGPSRKFGAAGDFVTAPEMSPLFGQCVAAQCLQWFAHAPAEIVEFGAGSGAMAADILETLRDEGALPSRYSIVELSGELRERQRRTLAERAPGALDRVQWLEALPTRIEGIVLANEVLDAMPVRLFHWSDGEVFERGVARGVADGSAGEDGRASLRYADRPADDEFAQAVRARLAVAWPPGEAPPRYVSEIGEQAQAWVRTLGSRLACGAMLLIDYGFPRGEFFHPQRTTGTLRCHYRHRVHDDPFLWPGLQDITAHVDFGAVREAANRAGLETLGFTSQARFLIDCGLLDRFAAWPREELRAWTRQAQAVQQLLSESEMGELFKVIAFGRDVPDAALGFRTRDRRDVLQ